MRKPLRWLETAGLVLGVIWLTAFAARSTGYLSAAGPAPLRFQPPAPERPPYPLPPLLVPDQHDPPPDGSPVAEGPPGAAGAGTTNHPVLPAAATVPHSGPIPRPAVLDFAPQDAAENAGIVSQSVLGLLLPSSTNGTGSQFLVPAFVPPVPPLPSHSSQATYETP